MRTMLIILVGCVMFPPMSVAESESKFTIYPIGYVKRHDGRTLIVLDKKYQAGLLGLEEWSHVQVLWWFDKNDTPEKRSILQVHPRGDKNNPLTGVFACRAPVRPNLIALTLCKILRVEENVVEVADIDAFDGTPVLDLKPYIPIMDSATDVCVPKWASPPRTE
ncbi:MAG: tRNA (N6-threonylcarbamoyladenosine(37)-N6)-methyltransferase TrmO [Thermogutta sp.]